MDFASLEPTLHITVEAQADVLGVVAIRVDPQGFHNLLILLLFIANNNELLFLEMRARPACPLVTVSKLWHLFPSMAWKIINKLFSDLRFSFQLYQFNFDLINVFLFLLRESS